MFYNRSSYSLVHIGDFADVGGMTRFETGRMLKMEMMDDDAESVVSSAGWLSV